MNPKPGWARNLLIRGTKSQIPNKYKIPNSNVPNGIRPAIRKRHMKLAFIADNDPDGMERDAAFAAQHGFDALEFNHWGSFSDLTDETVARTRALLDRHGIKACSLGLWGWNLLAPDPPERQEAHRMLNRSISFAQVLGADVLIFGAGEIPDASLSEKVAAFREMYPSFREKILESGLTPALYAVHGNSFLDSLEAYSAVWEHFPELTIKFDPANWMHQGQDYLDILRRHGDRIGHVHVKEHLYMGGKLVSQPAAGMGDVAWGKVMAFLYEHHYDGHLCFEPHGGIWSRGEMKEKMLLLSKKHLSQFLMP